MSQISFQLILKKKKKRSKYKQILYSIYASWKTHNFIILYIV